MEINTLEEKRKEIVLRFIFRENSLRVFLKIFLMPFGDLLVSNTSCDIRYNSEKYHVIRQAII